jgi:AcrR family transcriptional regulator
MTTPVPVPEEQPERSRKATILSTTVEMLRAREEVLVAEVARRSDVSIGLIYRHFGDLDTLIQHAWAEIFLNYELEDNQLLDEIFASPGTSVQDLVEWAAGIFHADRDDSGWMRLEALVANRAAGTPLPSVDAIRLRILDVYREMFVRVGLIPESGWPEERIEAALVLICGLPLGATAMMSRSMSDATRSEMAAAMIRAGFAILDVDPDSFVPRQS